jgi:hypothetical protein
MQRATPGILTLPSCSQVLTLAMTALAIRSRAGSPACASAAAASETCSPITSQYCAGESVTSSTPAARPATSRSPGLVQGTDISRGRAPEHARPARPEHPPELGGRPGHAGKEHVPEPYRDTAGCRITERQGVGAAHPGLNMGDPLRARPPRRDAGHLRRKAGQDDVSPRREPGHRQPRLARARGNVEMLLITGDAQTPDHRRADRAQLIHDDRVPLLPARRKPGPRRPLNVPDLITARHRPSRYQMHPPNTKALPGGST